MNAFSRTILTFILTIFAQVFASANIVLPTAETYRSGRQLCEVDHAKTISYEKGFYTMVPKDYRNPQGLKTPIYSYFSNGFDPNKSTLVYFTGGPGVTGHWGLFSEAMTFNVLIVDQRGIACSRPDHFADYMSPQFYSSETVARDVEEIRKALKIAQFSVYGISYGTVPATMYGSLFPTSTKALVLEGTLASGNGALWANEELRLIVQTLFDSLSPVIQKQIDRVHSEFGVSATWFHQMARNKLMYNDGAASFKNELETLVNEDNFQRLVETAKAMLAPVTYETHPLFSMNDVPYYMIACQELGLALPDVPVYYELKNGKLFPVADPTSQQACQKIQARSEKLFEASAYPVKVPVTYFQGSDDTATVASGAMAHFQRVPQGPKQMLLLRRGGHNPSLTNIKLGEPLQVKAFEKAVHGEAVSRTLMDRLNLSQPLQWQLTQENF